ncbi:MAG: cupin domain-containing protein [Chloroflexi bacterium]|nr:cupin domain-containing protein [Chloroflexota bacterium]
MTDPFPEPIRKLPLADIPLKGVTAYLAQGKEQQTLFMFFEEDVELPEHAHKAQWGLVIEGAIQMTIGGHTRTYGKGEHYFIPAGVAHSASIQAGYADITYFDEADRYGIKEDG